MNKQQLKELEFVQVEKCWHKCIKCGLKEPHQVPYGPKLPPVCHARIFVICLRCRTIPQSISHLPPAIQLAINTAEKRFAKLRRKRK